MKEKIEFDHFENIDDLLNHIEIWHNENDIYYTRWFGLEDLYKLGIYIKELLKENTALNQTQFNQTMMIQEIAGYKEKIDKAIEYIKNDFDEENDYFIPKKRLLEILGDKENEL